MNGLQGTTTSSFPCLHVAFLHFLFRIPNLTFWGGRPRNSETPQKSFSVAAVIWGNHTGTWSLGSSQAQKAPDPPLPRADSQLWRHVLRLNRSMSELRVSKNSFTPVPPIAGEKPETQIAEGIPRGHTVNGRVVLEATLQMLAQTNSFVFHVTWVVPTFQNN